MSDDYSDDEWDVEVRPGADPAVVVAATRRRWRDHRAECPDGEDCACELIPAESERIIVGRMTTDVDGDPLGVERHEFTSTGGSFRRPKRKDS